MTKTIYLRFALLLTMFFATLSAVKAADRLYIDPTNIEPGETTKLALQLENDRIFYGFQADITLPEGLEILTSGNGRADISLSSRCDDSFHIVSNLMASGTIRLGAFSTTHKAISGTSGALVYLPVRASDDFVGGSISLTDILCVGEGDHDVALPDYKVNIGTEHNDYFYIEDFKITVGETKRISIILDNETAFTAFQTDIILPEGLNFVAGSLEMTARGAAGHSLTAKSFSGGRTRIICFDTSVIPFTGNTGALVSFEVTATKDIAKTSKIRLTNQIFSKTQGKEYVLPDATCTVSTERALIQDILLNYSSIDLIVGNTEQLSARITPDFASAKDLEWASLNPEIASVSPTGLVTALALGSTTVRATAADGSGVFAECAVNVVPTVAQGISINQTGPIELNMTQTFRLTATVSPEDATDKSVTWQTSNTEVAIVDASGLVTPIAVGECEIIATNSAGDTASISVIVSPAPIKWSQTFECSPGESIALTAGYENAYDVSYRCIRPDGGFNYAEFSNSDGRWFVKFPNEGAYILEAYSTTNPNISIRKVFNVVSPDDLIYVDGIYYRYIDTSKTKLKVVRGYNIYSGDYTIPASVMGLEVVAIDDFAFYSCTDLGGVFIEEGIKSIGSQSFGNGSLSEISIPASVEEIALYAFNALNLIDNHYSLMSISLYGLTPISVDPAIFNGFINYDLCELHVPYGTAHLYATADVWKDFTKLIDDLPDYIEVKSIEIQQGDEVSVLMGQTLQLTAKVLPENATDKSVIWYSSDPDCVSVDVNGLIEARAKGDAEITVQSVSNSALTDICKVSVDVVSGIDKICIDNIKVEIDGLNVYIENITGSHATMFSIDGLSIPVKYNDEKVTMFEAPAFGYYILRLGSITLKVKI